MRKDRKDKASRFHKGKPRRTTRRGALLPSVPFRIILPAKRGFVHRKIKKDKNFSVSRRFDASAGTLCAEDGAVYRQDPTSAPRLAERAWRGVKDGTRLAKAGEGADRSAFPYRALSYVTASEFSRKQKTAGLPAVLVRHRAVLYFSDPSFASSSVVMTSSEASLSGTSVRAGSAASVSGTSSMLPI